MADLKDLINTPDTTAEFDPNDIQQNKVMAILAYIGICGIPLFLIPLLAAKNSKFAKFHANQGLVLWIANIAIGIIFGIIRFVVGLLGVKLLSTLVSLLSGLVSILLLALMILGIVNAATGKAKELPIIGKIKLLK